MCYIIILLAIIAIIGGMLLLAIAGRDKLGGMFKLSSWLIILIIIAVLVCAYMHKCCMPCSSSCTPGSSNGSFKPGKHGPGSDSSGTSRDTTWIEIIINGQVIWVRPGLSSHPKAAINDCTSVSPSTTPKSMTKPATK
jgi:hypothetical protein